MLPNDQETEDQELTETNEQAEEIRPYYEVKADASFTLDEQQEINDHKQRLDDEIKSKKGVTKAFETLFLNLSVFAVARWIVLSSGQSGLGLAIILIFLVNQVVNRDCLEGFNVNYHNSQWQFLNVEKIIKVLAGLILASAMGLINVGEFYQKFEYAQTAYNAVQMEIEKYNNLNQPQKDDSLKNIGFGALLVLGVIYMYNKSKSSEN